MLRWIFILTQLASISLASTTGCAKIWFTVSSLWKTIENRSEIVDSQLEINWRYNCTSNTRSQIIRVFNDDPTKNNNLEAQLTFERSNYPKNYYRTNISVDRSLLQKGWNETQNATSPGARCLKHYVALYDNETVLTYSCLEIRPTWMYNLRTEIGNLPISSLMIPGTHNSGCYYEGNLTVFDIIRYGYLLTQDRDVWTQLVYGVRYLDLRVGWYSLATNESLSNSTNTNNRDEHFWINHDFVKVRPLKEVLNQLKDFLVASPGEVVILDFHRFPVGFKDKPSRHRTLVSILIREFGNALIAFDARKSLGPTLNDIWKNKKQIIICYGDKRTVHEYDFLWPPMTQAWGNKQKTDDLLEYLEEKILNSTKSTNSNPLWALMAELTPQIWDIIFRTTGNLRQMADSVNRNLTLFFESKPSYCEQSNVVATDFFLGNNLIDLAVRSNFNRGCKLENKLHL